jgi:hypothetical protein
MMRQVPFDRLHIDRRRQEVDHRIEQRLDTLVLERRAAEHRRDEPTDGRRANRVTNLVVGQLLAAQVLLDQLLVVRDGRLDQLVAGQLHRVLHVRRHVHHRERLAERLLVEDVLLARNDIDVAREQLARADRQLDRVRVLR